MTVLEVVSRAALALLGASLAVVVVGSVRGARRSIRGIRAGTPPDPEGWDLIRAFHAPVFHSTEIVAGVVALIALLLLPVERSLPIVVYGWVFVMVVSGFDRSALWLWRRRSRPGTRASAPVPPVPLDTLVLSAQEQGWRFTIPSGQPAVLGRQEGRVDVCLPDVSVARRHAQVQAHEGSWHIEDLGSHCGIFVNDMAIHGQKIIRPGDVVRVGRIRLTVLAAVASTGGAPLGGAGK